MGDIVVEEPKDVAENDRWNWLRRLWRRLCRPGSLILLMMAAVALLVLPTSPTLKWASVTLGILMFAGISSDGRPDTGSHLLNYFIEACISALLASALVTAMLDQRGSIHLDKSHLIVAFALGIVLSGISIVSRSALTIRSAQKDLDDAAKRFDKAYQELSRSSESVEKSAENAASVASELDTALQSFKQEIGKAHLVGIAARAVSLKGETIEYPPIQGAISSAIGTMRTWAEGTRKAFPQAKQGDPREITCDAAEAGWWRSLESYHNEERYDLARFEMVTNARNYTYVLTSVLDEIRKKEGLDKSEAAVSSQVVTLQCSTFNPKDFYNFPQGSRDYRRYSDVEFYGTYRRAVSFLNRLNGMFPHRIVFVASDKCEDRNADEIAGDLERLGWALDTPAEVALGTSRLFGLPFSAPVRRRDDDERFVGFSDDGWFDFDGEELESFRTGLGKEQICPVVPNIANAPGDDEHFPKWLEKARSHAARALYGKELSALPRPQKDKTRESVAQAITAFKAPPVESIARREQWVWENVLCASEAALKDRSDADDRKSLCDAFEKLEGLRSKMRDLLTDPTGEAECRLCEVAQGILLGCQRYDGVAEELKAKLARGVVAGEKWIRLRSMIGLHMGPGEAWAYHAFNLINSQLFSEVAGGRTLVPLWDLFSWDFLGFTTPEVKGRRCRAWAASDPKSRGIKERIRFVPVAPGMRVDLPGVNARGDIAALGFDNSCFEREFTLVGTRPSGADGEASGNPFKGVDWKVLLTCDMAPPYSTCRLNFHFPGAEGSLLREYVSWGEDVWLRTEETSAQLFNDIRTNLDAVDPIPPQQP